MRRLLISIAGGIVIPLLLLLFFIVGASLIGMTELDWMLKPLFNLIWWPFAVWEPFFPSACGSCGPSIEAVAVNIATQFVVYTLLTYIASAVARRNVYGRRPKWMKALTILSLALLLQLGCQSIGTTKVDETTKVEWPPEREAQKLLDGGLDFQRTAVQDGISLTTGCGYIHGADYVSSDGVEVRAPYYRCIEAVDAAHCFENNLRDATEVFKNQEILDSDQQPIGRRLVGARGTDQYFITYLAGVSCFTHTASSLSHLLAFEKWRRARL